MIKLIVSDIDGTLVPDGSHEMNPELLDVIMKIREKGYSLRLPAGVSGPALNRSSAPSKKRYFTYPTTEPTWAAMAGIYF